MTSCINIPPLALKKIFPSRNKFTFLLSNMMDVATKTNVLWTMTRSIGLNYSRLSSTLWCGGHPARGPTSGSEAESMANAKKTNNFVRFISSRISIRTPATRIYCKNLKKKSEHKTKSCTFANQKEIIDYGFGQGTVCGGAYCGICSTLRADNDAGRSVLEQI